jgi:hypothetical protein
MSAYGPKLPPRSETFMAAFGSKADTAAVRGRGSS